jgi:DNA-binding transcriptional regulator YhcF (GntR family)
VISLNGLPAELQVRQAFTKLVDQAHHEGQRPSVLALARQFGLSNTTFRRHYPEIVRELGQIRRTPATAQTEPSAATEHSNLIARNAELRRAVQELRQDLELAIANIARLTLDNHHLRTELEQARRITNIKTRSTSD